MVRYGGGGGILICYKNLNINGEQNTKAIRDPLIAQEQRFHGYFF